MILRTDEGHSLLTRCLNMLVKIGPPCIVGLLYDNAGVGPFLVGLEDLIK